VKHRDRKAYQWSAEVSVYADEKFHGKGIATALYDTLFDLLKLQGILNLYAGITQPNQKSVNFHRKHGFTEIGLFKNIGYKLNRWHDVLWMYRSLDLHPPNPSDPLHFNEIIESDSVKKVLEKANLKQ
jgi:phosphinothricin acetyltransferase